MASNDFLLPILNPNSPRARPTTAPSSRNPNFNSETITNNTTTTATTTATTTKTLGETHSQPKSHSTPYLNSDDYAATNTSTTTTPDLPVQGWQNQYRERPSTAGSGSASNYSSTFSDDYSDISDAETDTGSLLIAAAASAKKRLTSPYTSPVKLSSTSTEMTRSPSLLSPRLFTRRFHRLVQDERIRQRSSGEKAAAIQSLGIELELQGRTTRLENEIDSALESTLKAYSILRKTYSDQRDNFLPLDFLMNGLENQRGHPFVKEIAASRVLKWMARALLRPKIRSRFNTWLIYMRWFRFLHRCRRGVKKITKWYHRQSLRRWVTYTAWHRKQEMERASVQLQRIVRAHFGRITAYKRLLFVTAWSIQYFWHRSKANLVVMERRARREGARKMQRMMRWAIDRRVAATKLQAWSRAHDAYIRHLRKKWITSWLQRHLFTIWTRDEYNILKTQTLIVQTRWRQRDAWRKVYYIRCAREIQRMWKGNRARVKCFHKRRARAVPPIQCWFRCYVARGVRRSRWMSLLFIQKYLLMWAAMKRYKLMMAGRNRAKKKARIRVSVRPIHGEFHVVAAVRPGRLEWIWKSVNGRKTAVPKYIVGKGLELQIFRVEDGKDYRGFISHEELLRRHRMYTRRGKQFEGGVYTKEFVNLLFDQVQIHTKGGTAGIVQTTRTERGHLVSSFGVKRPRSIRAASRKDVPSIAEDPEDIKLRTYVVQVFKHLDNYVFRSFDPDIQRTYRCEIPEQELLLRLRKPDCPLDESHKILNVMKPEGFKEKKKKKEGQEESQEEGDRNGGGDSDGDSDGERKEEEKKNSTRPRLIGISREALAWLTTRMVIQDRYLMQAYWKSPLFDEGVMILDQAEDVMAAKIQCCWRHRAARQRMFELVKIRYRKYWSSEFQSYFYQDLDDEEDTKQWTKPWIIDACFRAYVRCDKLPKERLIEIPKNPYKRKIYLEADKTIQTRVDKYREYLLEWTGYDYYQADIEVLDQWDKLEQNDGTVVYWNGSRDVYSPYSEDMASDLIATFYRRNIISELALPSLAHLAKSIMFHRRVKADYEKKPDSLAAILNFALLNHTVLNDMPRAKVLYEEAYKMSSSNPTVLYCYGLFVLANRDYKFRHPQGKKGLKLLADALSLDDRQEKFKTAEDTFFRASVLLNPSSAAALRNLGLVLTHIQQDFKASDRMYARSLKLDMYDESTQLNYLDFLEGLKHASLDKKGRTVKAGPYRLAGPPIEVKAASSLLVRPDSHGWERWENPNPKCRSHRTFWYRPETHRAHYLSPYWEPRGFNKEETTIMMAKKRVELAGQRYRIKAPAKVKSPSSQLGVWEPEKYVTEENNNVGDGNENENGNGEQGNEQGPEITGELDPNEQAEMIAARVSRDMSLVRELLDSTHTKLSEMDLFAVKNARSLKLRVDATDNRTRDYNHESHEYEIGRLTREAEEQQKRLAELNTTLATQREEMARRDQMYAEQTAMVLESSESIKLFETVLSKKQRNLMQKKREMILAGMGSGGGNGSEDGGEGEDDGVERGVGKGLVESKGLDGVELEVKVGDEADVVQLNL